MSGEREETSLDKMKLGELIRSLEPSPGDDSPDELENGSSPHLPGKPRPTAEVSGGMTQLDVRGTPTDIRAFIARRAPLAGDGQ
jgi:hypothetical protein